ncbi:MAG: hypothetical protein K2N63_16075 [Lachnospiraceae bacterium]|nr:hypothetical protein [Lachnospiraceae bacterium]
MLDSLTGLVLGLLVIDAGMKGRTNFILPDNGKLRLYKTDRGRDFVKQRRLNGRSCRGTKEEVMAQVKESLRARGYHPRFCACFRDVDVIKTLQKIMEHNTEYYQTDFRYDRETLTAAKDGKAPSIFSGLPAVGEPIVLRRDRYIWRRSAHIITGTQMGTPRAFWMELQGQDVEGDMVRGNILEIDYQKHLDYLSTHSTTPVWVDAIFQNRLRYRTFGFREYEKDWQSII